MVPSARAWRSASNTRNTENPPPRLRPREGDFFMPIYRPGLTPIAICVRRRGALIGKWLLGLAGICFRRYETCRPGPVHHGTDAILDETRPQVRQIGHSGPAIHEWEESDITRCVNGQKRLVSFIPNVRFDPACAAPARARTRLRGSHSATPITDLFYLIRHQNVLVAFGVRR